MIEHSTGNSKVLGSIPKRSGSVPFFTEIVFRYQIGYWHPNMHMEETTQKDSIKERYKDLDSKEFFI